MIILARDLKAGSTLRSKKTECYFIVRQVIQGRRTLAKLAVDRTDPGAWYVLNPFDTYEVFQWNGEHDESTSS